MKERLGAGIVATVIAVAVGILTMGAMRTPVTVPAGDYVLVEGEVREIEVSGLRLSSDGATLSGNLPCNTFVGEFMTAAGCIWGDDAPPIADDYEVHRILRSEPVLADDRIVFENYLGRLVYVEAPADE